MALRATMTAIGLSIALAAGASAQQAKPRPDFADLTAGTYHGDVISDARGSSRSDVTITVAKTAPNTVSVTADYPRIPARSFKLTRAMDTVQNVGGTEVFLADLSKTPLRLDLTIADASWSGERTAAAPAEPKLKVAR